LKVIFDGTYGRGLLYLVGGSPAGPNSLIDASVSSSPIATDVSWASPYALAPNGNLYVLGQDGTARNINVRTGSSGVVLDSNVFAIAVGPNGAFFELKNNTNLWQLTSGSTWTYLDTGLSVFQVAGNGMLLDMKQNGNFWMYGAGTWSMIASQVFDFGIGQDGAIVYQQLGGSIWIAFANLYNPNGPELVVARHGSLNFDTSLDVLNGSFYV
jgi:hypothetical protein